MPSLVEETSAFIVTLRHVLLFETAVKNDVRLDSGNFNCLLENGERVCLIDRIRAGDVVPPEETDDRAPIVEWLADRPDEAESI